MAIKLNNPSCQWVNPEKVKIGKCKKCKGYQSVGWLFPHMAQYRDCCFGECNSFQTFTVQPGLIYVPPVGSGYVMDGIATIKYK